MNQFASNLERIKRDILNLSQFISSTDAGYTRISLSGENRRAREHVVLLIEKEAGLEVRIDAAGNLIGRRKGKVERPSILVGSHIDTVRGGGRFDGVLGVIAGFEVVRIFGEREFENIHPSEVVVFLAEEPSAFGLSTIGSRAMAGNLSEEQLTSLKDDRGRNLGAAIREMEGEPEKLLWATIARRYPGLLGAPYRTGPCPLFKKNSHRHCKRNFRHPRMWEPILSMVDFP